MSASDQSVVTMLPSECVPGRWYEHPRWGRVLCCGTGDSEVWLPAFAVRDDEKRTKLKFMADTHNILSECDQSW